MEFFLVNAATAWRLIAQFQGEGVSAFIPKRCFILVGIDDAPLRIEIFGSDVQWLMNISDIMSQ
jgi:hypothetical protein